ncbi:hypothetical protein, partial [Pseudarthrobacter oxydans]|uniref:hypothetical protein n=1 Tax=Pseudarthrobacter oxydans TaxID=1671 RepID=UPI003F4E2448
MEQKEPPRGGGGFAGRLWRTWVRGAGDVPALRKIRPGQASWIQAAHFASVQDALAGHDVGGGAQALLVLLRHLPDARKGLLHDANQAGVDLVFATEDSVLVLHRLEVAHRHAA